MTPTALTFALRPARAAINRRLRRPCHIPLHIFHSGTRLERYTSGIESYAFADEGDRPFILNLRCAV